jgi:hypothetical protein
MVVRADGGLWRACSALANDRAMLEPVHIIKFSKEQDIAPYLWCVIRMMTGESILIATLFKPA